MTGRPSLDRILVLTGICLLLIVLAFDIFGFKAISSKELGPTIDVAEGQPVERGQVLGRSGETGLAGGDHLHFTMLLAGLPVDPVEWWDAAWIRDRVAAKLGPALPFED